MTTRQYRRLTANERQYLIENYDDDPSAIAQIAAHLRKEPSKILDHARYLKLRERSCRHAWSESELTLLDDMAETQPLNLLVAAWNRLAKKQGRPTRSLRSLEKKLWERGHSLKPYGGYLSVLAVATLLNCSQTWVKTLIEHKKLRAIKDGNYWSIKPQWLRKFVFNHPYDATERLDKEQFADLLLAIGDRFGSSCGDRL